MSLESYSPVKTIIIPGYDHQRIQGVIVEIPTAPFSSHSLESFSVVGIDEKVEGDGTNLRRLSEHHNRSYEYFEGQKIVWVDEFGNLYTTLNSKGNNLTNPALARTFNTPSGLLLFGLQESNGMVRMLEASRIMRENGIETEAFVKVIEPLTLPYYGVDLPLNEFKRVLADISLETGITLPEHSVDIINKLGDLTFFITVRAMGVNERLADLDTLEGDDLVRAVGNAFYYTNLYEKIQQAKDPSYKARHFDLNREDDIDYYFSTYLPEKIGRNYAKLHSLGLVHKYAAASNITLTGAIVDLDSIYGPLLGDGNEARSLPEVEDSEVIGVELHLLKDVMNKKLGIDAESVVSSYGRGYLTEALKSKTNNALLAANLEWTFSHEGQYTIDENGDMVEPKSMLEGYLNQKIEQFPVQTPDMKAILKSISEEELWRGNNVPLSREQRAALVTSLVKSFVRLEYGKFFGQFEINDKVKYFIELAMLEAIETKTKEIVNAFREDIDLAIEIPEGQDSRTPQSSQAQIDVFHRAFLHTIKELGWEDDILNHAVDIENAIILSTQDDTSDDKFLDKALERYLKNITYLTGIDLPVRETHQELTEDFFEYDNDKANQAKKLFVRSLNLGEGLTSESQHTVRAKEIRDTLIALSFYFNVRQPQLRFHRFAIHYVTDRLAGEQQLYHSLNRAIHNPEAAKVIEKWFIARWEIKRIRNLTGDDLSKIDQEFLERFGESLNFQVLEGEKE